jgi:DNA repair photolyase
MERELIARRCPIQIGCNSDPLQPIENMHHTTLRLLRMLAGREYPAIITTKFPDRLLAPEYTHVIGDLPLLVQCSVSSGDERMLRRLEPGAPSMEKRLGALTTLHEAGVHVMLRLAPFAPDLVGDVVDLLARAHDAGVRTVQCGPLKVYHANGSRQRLNEALGYNYLQTSQLAYENCGVFSAITLAEQQAAIEKLERQAAELGVEVLTCDDATGRRSWRCCCGTDGLDGFEAVAEWAYFVNGYRITDHTTFEEYIRGHDCPWHAEFEQEWNAGKLERALPELIFNQDDKTYTRMW